MFKKIKSLCLLLYITTSVSYSQTELTLPFMENIHQCSYVNPSAIPDHKFSLGLPGISSMYFDFTNTGFNLGNLKNDQKKIYDPYGALNAMDKTNYLNIGTKVDLFSMRFKARDWYFMTNVTENVNFKFNYSKDLFSFLLQGNGNQSVYDFKEVGIDFNHYREYGIGFTRETKKIIFGGRFKLLQGLTNIHSDTRKMEFTTDQNGMYDLSATADGTIYGSSPFLDTNFINNPDILKYVNNFKNIGGAIDLGFTYKLTPKLHFVISALNMGYINWNKDLVKYTIKGGNSFTGADVVGKYLNGNQGFQFQEVVDSMKAHFVTETTRGEKYRTWLIPSFYLQTNYHVWRNTSFGAAFYLEKFIQFRPTFTIMANQKVGRALSVIGTYSIKFNQFNNIGIGLVFKPGPFDFYFVGDNLLVPIVQSAFDGFYLGSKVVDPLKTINFRTGMNLVFGRIKKPDNLPYWGL